MSTTAQNTQASSNSTFFILLLILAIFAMAFSSIINGFSLEKGSMTDTSSASAIMVVSQ